MLARSSGIRAIASVAAGLLAAAMAPSASAGVAQQRVFVVAGGGTRTPTTGVAATDASLRIARLTAAADGSVVFVHQGEDADEMFSVGRDGRLHELPLPAVPVTTAFGSQLARVDDLDARQDGTLVIALDDRVWELSPGGAWQALPALAAGPLPGVAIDSLATIPSGTLVGRVDRVWRLDHAGVPVAEYRLPRSGDGYSLLGLTGVPGGGFAFTWEGDASLTRWDPGTHWRQTSLLELSDLPDLAPLPDRSLVAAEGPLVVYSPRGHRRILAGRSPALGSGDGGPLANALIDARLIARTRLGALVIAAGLVADPLGPIDLTAYRGPNGIITRADNPVLANVIAIAGRHAGQPPAVALSPRTFQLLDDARVAYHTSMSGRATLTITRAGRVVTQRTRSVSAGDGEWRLAHRLPRGNYRITLRVENGTSAAIHRLAVSLAPALTSRRALRLARTLADDDSPGGDGGGGAVYKPRRCRPIARLRHVCAELEYVYDDWTESGEGVETVCKRVITVLLRRDGARAYSRYDPRRCRWLLTSRRGSGT